MSIEFGIMLHGIVLRIEMKELIKKSGKESFTEDDFDELFSQATENAISSLKKAQDKQKAGSTANQEAALREEPCRAAVETIE